MIRAVLRRFENNTVFTKDEAWMLFRLTAFSEAVGWTLLIIGLGLSKYVLAGNQLPVLLAGRVHGVLFLGYALAAAGLYPALGWSRKRALIALLASAPPYGSLVFERYASVMIDKQKLTTSLCCIVLFNIG